MFTFPEHFLDFKTVSSQCISWHIKVSFAVNNSFSFSFFPPLLAFTAQLCNSNNLQKWRRLPQEISFLCEIINSKKLQYTHTHTHTHRFTHTHAHWFLSSPGTLNKELSPAHQFFKLFFYSPIMKLGGGGYSAPHLSRPCLSSLLVKQGRCIVSSWLHSLFQ